MRGAPLGHTVRGGAPSGFEAGWSEVVRKRHRYTVGGAGRLDVATSAWNISYHDTISFFFTEFPETHGAKDMLKAFKLYGEAMEVVIPPKRDKRGKRFGFVRFRNVSDPRVFAIHLDNIIFGANKIHANIPKFQRESSATYMPKVGPRQVATKQRPQPNFHQQRQVLNVWRKKEEEGNGGRKMAGQGIDDGRKKEIQMERTKIQKSVTHNQNTTPEVRYSISEEDMLKFRKMYIGTVRTPGSTYYVHEWFSMQGFFSIKITPLGANKVLMEDMEEGTRSCLVTTTIGYMRSLKI